MSDAGESVADVDGGTRDEALRVLRAVLTWRLREPRWSTVAQEVGVMSAALRSGGVAAIRGSIDNLELIAPVRAANFGDPPTVEPPPSVREEINELIHSLDGRSENDDGPDDGELCR